ncbi:MAG: TldD/PmbA family protein [Candidatus Nezhaarchaeales archaeon]
MRVGRLIDECINRGAQYADCISIIAKKLQVDYVDKNIVVNKSSSKVYILKALMKGNWGLSVALEPDSSMISEALRQATAKGPGSIKLAKRKPVQGGYVMCQKRAVVDSDGSEVVDYVKNVVSAIEKGCNDNVKVAEGHVEASLIAKAMMSSDGVNAYEIKPSLIASFTAQTSNGEVASVEVCGSGGFEVLENINPQSIADEILFKLSCMSKSKMLNPYYKGSRFDVILSPHTAASIIQVVVESTLNAQNYKRSIYASCDELTIIDDPTLDGGYGSFFFDDEGVKARRKKLIESGKLVSLIHNRETAYIYGVEPTGNGRGLAEPPQPRHSNIIVKPGDWDFKEMIEETKLGFLIDGVRNIHLVDELVIMEPEASLLIKRGEVKEPVKIGHFAVNLYEFYLNIKAIASSPLGSAPGSIGDYKSASYSPPIKIELRAF